MLAIASYFFLRAVPILTAKNESDPVLQPCGTPGSGGAGQPGRSPRKSTCASTRVFFLILMRIEYLPLALVLALPIRLEPCYVELDLPAAECLPVDRQPPGDDHDAVLEALRRHREADLSWNDGLPLGRPGRVRLRRPGHVRREGRAPYPVARVRGVRENAVDVEERELELGARRRPDRPGQTELDLRRSERRLGARCDCVDVQRNGERRPCDVDVQVPDGLVQAGSTLVVRVVRGIVGDDAAVHGDLGVPAVAEDQLSADVPDLRSRRLREVHAVAERRVDRVLRRRVIRRALDVAEQKAGRRTGLVVRCGDGEARRVRSPG